MVSVLVVNTVAALAGMVNAAGALPVTLADVLPVVEMCVGGPYVSSAELAFDAFHLEVLADEVGDNLYHLAVPLLVHVEEQDVVFHVEKQPVADLFEKCPVLDGGHRRNKGIGCIL